jgi:two-component system chemotaxis response regulator CheY
LSHRILIVDDSPAMQAIIERVIHLCGVEVEQVLRASNGNDALALLDRQEVDLILTDINMPGSDGEDLVRRLAGQDRLRNIPVIVVSTDSTQNRMNHLLELGVKGYLGKPFTPEKLRAAIEQILEVAHA